MKKAVSFLLIVIAAITACKKKDKEDDIIPEPPVVHTIDKVIISPNNPEVTVIDIDPDTTLPYRDSLDFKLDIDADNTPDFNIHVANITFTPAHFHGFTTITIENLNEDSYVLTDSIYPKKVFHKDTLVTETPVNQSYPKILAENDVIYYSDIKWRKGKQTISFSYNTYSNTPFDLIANTHESGWFNVDKKCIGLKSKHKLGWIKIGITASTTSDNRIKIYEYTSTKN